MPASRQSDLFDHEVLNSSAAHSEPPVYRPDLGMVRAKLQQILAEARAATAVPWDADRLLVYRTIFPHMTNWLPEDEAAQLRFDFEAELARLRVA